MNASRALTIYYRFLQGPAYGLASVPAIWGGRPPDATMCGALVKLADAGWTVKVYYEADVKRYTWCASRTNGCGVSCTETHADFHPALVLLIAQMREARVL